VAGHVSSIKVTPVTTDPAATVTVNGTLVTSGTESAAIVLNVGTNTIVTKVTASDGVTFNNYSITITRQPPPVVTLNSLRFNPAIATTTVAGPDFRDYTATVANSIDSVTVTPTVTDPAATVKVNGITVASGAPSGAIALTVGSNTITTVVTGSDGITQATYKAVITRQGNALLRSLSFNPDLVRTTVPGPDFKDYTATVGNYVSSVKVTPVTVDPAATVKVNGKSVASGAPSLAIPLAVGSNTIVIVVTSSDNLTNTYSITITRQGTAIATLNSLTLDPAITRTTVAGPHFRDYTAKVSYEVTAIKVTPVLTDPASTVTVNGVAVVSGAASAPIPLIVGNNIINTVVTASDGVTFNMYSMVVTRSPAIATLNSLRFDPSVLKTTIAGPDYRDYTATVENSVSSINVIPVATDAAATVTVNGIKVVSGAATSIPLSVGNTTITTVVTAADAITTLTYKTVVTRKKGNAFLKRIEGVNAGLIPVSGPHYRDYTVELSNDRSSIGVRSLPADPTSTIKVVALGQTHLQIGDLSWVQLAVGQTVIDVIVTAADSVTTNTYEITATRMPPLPPVLQSLTFSPSITLTEVTGADYKDYTASVPTNLDHVVITPVVVDPWELSIEINGQHYDSGDNFYWWFGAGTNVLTIKVTAKDHITSNTYRITINKPHVLGIRDGTPQLFTDDGGGIGLEQGAGVNEFVGYAPSFITKPLLYVATEDPTATLTVNGLPGFSPQIYSAYINLNVGINTYVIVITAADGLESETYKVIITHQQAGYDATAYPFWSPSINARIVPGTRNQDWVGTVSNEVTAVRTAVKPDDPAATIKINGVATPYNTYTAPIALSVGVNTVVFEITSANGLNIETHTTKITRAGPSGGVSQPSEEKSAATLGDAVVVHQSLSPNGDGVGDRFLIDGITAYPDNKLSIIDKSGRLVYQVKGYDNVNRVFDGTSNITGRLQHAGTYFYSLDYTASGQLMHKTGYIIIKY